MRDHRCLQLRGSWSQKRPSAPATLPSLSCPKAFSIWSFDCTKDLLFFTSLGIQPMRQFLKFASPMGKQKTHNKPPYCPWPNGIDNYFEPNGLDEFGPGGAASRTSYKSRDLKRKMIFVDDDANYNELKACQHKLLAASSWAMIFEDQPRDLKRKMSKMSQGTGDGNNKIDVASACDDTNSTCPLPLNTTKQQKTPSLGTCEQQATPPPKIAMTSKQAGKRVVCNVRKDLFGKHKRDREE